MRGERLCVVVACMLAAGCDDGEGLVVEVVVGDPAIKTVELVVGGACEECPDKMGAPQLSLRHTTIRSALHDTVWEAAVNADGIAGFELQAQNDRRVPAIALIGRDAGGVVRATAALANVEVPAGEGLVARVKLAPNVNITDDVPPSTALRIAAWRDGAQTAPSCVMIERWHDGVVEREGIVPSVDTDCDNAAMECHAYWPDAMVPANADTASCLVRKEIATEQVCIAGGRTCSETTVVPGACLPLDADYCSPSAVCTCGTDFGCLVDLLLAGTSSGSTPSAYCIVPVDAEGTACGGDTMTTLDVSSLLAGNGAQCTAMTVYDNWLGGTTVTSDGVEIGMNVLRLSAFRQPGIVDVTWSNLAAGNASTTVTWLALRLDNGKHLVVPFRVDVVTDCQRGLDCFAQVGAMPEPMYACAQP